VQAILDQTTWGPAQFQDSAGKPMILSTHLEQGVFFHASLKQALFNLASLDGSTFEGATLDGVDFRTTANVVNVSNIRPPQHGARTSCLQCNFKDSVHTNTHFEGVFLEGANFSNARLEQSTLAGADVKGANFSGTHLTGTDLSRADFSVGNGVILSAQTVFDGAIFSDGVAHGVNLADQVLPAGGAFLKGQNLAFSNLSGVSLEDADLQGITLNSANLTDINWTGSNLEGANLSNAVLRNATLAFTSLRHATLSGIQAGVAPGNSDQATSFKGAYMPSVNLTDTDLRSADLRDAHIYRDATTGSFLIRTKLDSADLSGAILSGAAFSGSLTDAVFDNAVLVNRTFNGANLTNAKFDNAYLQGANFTGASSVHGASFINAAFATATQCLAGSDQPAPPCAWDYTEQDGTPVVVGYSATVLGALATDSTVLCPRGDRGPCTPPTLMPKSGGPYPPKPACVPAPLYYCNCIPADQGGCAPPQ
jgi:uncharacterized protein YjbI with pentapeptide repeats